MIKIRRTLSLSLIAIILFSITQFSTANAHSVLENSTPGDGEQLSETINRIELSFNTRIENGSTLTLVNDTGDVINPSSHEINDNMLVATFEDSLEPGSYQVNWKVVGADGHLIENQYSFTIKESEITLGKENAGQSEDERNITSSENSQTVEYKEDELEDQDVEKQNRQANENDSSSIVNIIIITLIIAGLGLLAWMLFSKNKK
ncbi:copper resistance protein CopC [Ureibacillus massiliensis]|nr:copper resistance protein CopC [Ureibacillus massiliensis]BDH63592.1 hypothetical protein MTP04_37220 [Lysinibacillus sp. PLM2]